MIRTASGRWAIPLEEAKAAVAGYAFATWPVHEQPAMRGAGRCSSSC